MERVGRSGGFVPVVGFGDELLAIGGQWVGGWPQALVTARLAKTTQRPICMTFCTNEGKAALSAAEEVNRLVQTLGTLLYLQFDGTCMRARTSACRQHQ